MKKRLTFTLNQETIDTLKETSELTMIPQSRIVEEAIKLKCEELRKNLPKK